MKAGKLITGLMVVSLAMLAMGCSAGRLSLNSNPMSRDDSRSTPNAVQAGWNDLASNNLASQEFVASPDGRYMVVAGNENGVMVLDAVTGDVVHEFDTRHRNVMVNYSPCGELVAACDAEGVMRIWKLSTGKLISEQQMSPAKGS